MVLSSYLYAKFLRKFFVFFRVHNRNQSMWGLSHYYQDDASVNSDLSQKQKK